MKRLFILAGMMFFFAFSAAAQAEFTFEEEQHDFGTVKESKDTLWHSFKFKNTGMAPLVIDEIETSCNCTLADYKDKPVPPGKTGVIRGGFAIEGKPGVFNKTLSITANTMPATTILTIKGVVKEPGQ